MEIIRCLRLKVWDSEAQRMVSLGDLRSPNDEEHAHAVFAKRTPDF
jgi:hypothetical protein